MHEIVFSPAAVRQFKRPLAVAPRLIKETIRERLLEQEPTEEIRNRFRLRRISEHADYALRVDPWHVFDHVRDTTLTVELISEKKENILTTFDERAPGLTVWNLPVSPLPDANQLRTAKQSQSANDH